jgi:hypothetical protein
MTRPVALATSNNSVYCGLIQGIQKSDRSGSTGTWS